MINSSMHSVVIACTITTLITTYIYIASSKVQLSQQLHCSVSYRWGYRNISNLSHSCFMHIRDLRPIRPMLDSTTASKIATCIGNSKLDYCNSLFMNLDSTQIHRLQLIQNSLARAVTRTPRHHHITPVLKLLTRN